MNKVIVFGLDGATWKVLKPLCDQDKLPNIKRLMTEGVFGELESTFPPVTGPAWLSMATGKNPGKTGVFDFLNRAGEQYSHEVIDSSKFRDNKAYWDYLDKNGFRIIIVNYPMLYPPYKINGVMISGTGAPTEEEITYPPGFRQELNKIANNYQVSLPWDTPKYRHNLDLFLRDLDKLLQKRIKVNEYLLQKDWDLMVTIFSVPDYLQHVMWKYWENQFLSPELTLKFIQTWQRIDEGVGKLCSLLPSNTNILIVSDHGFGPLRGNFLINKWLAQQGFLIKKTGIRTGLKAYFQSKLIVSHFGRAMQALLKKLSPNIYNFVRRKVVSDFTIPPLNQIDMSQTKAFASGYTSSAHGGIYLQNCDGIEYEAIRERIINGLREFGDLHGIKIDCYKREEIYWGAKVNLAPDILFKVNDHEYNIQTTKLDGEILQKTAPFVNKSGSHRKEGIFIAYGPDIKEGAQIRGAKIYDIAPTILHMFGLPIPDDMDGRVLKEIFKEGSEPARREVKYQQVDVERERVKDTIRRLEKSRKL